MKKAPAMILLVVVGFATMLITTVVSVFIVGIVHIGMTVTGGEIIYYAAAEVALLVITFVADCIRRWYLKEFEIKAPLYLALVYAPITVLNLVYAISIFQKHPKKASDYFIVTGALMLSAAIWLIVRTIRGERKFSVKKGFVITSVLIGAFAVSFTLMLINTLLVGLLEASVLGYAIAVLLTLAAAFGIDIIRQILGKAFSIKAPLFWVLTYVPQLLFAAGLFIYAWNRNRHGYWFGGVGEFMYYYAIPISNSVFAASGALWIMISAIIGKRRKVTLNESEN